MIDHSQEFVRRMKKRERKAFDDFFEAYRNEAFRAAYLISGNYADSEDIVQESFIQCYLHIGELREEKNLRAWFFRILTRTAWRICKVRRREQPVEDIYEQADQETGDYTVNAYLLSESQRELLEQVNKLNIKQRTTVILYYFDNLSVPEISRIMNCLEGTVKSRLHTARRNLKSAIEAQE